MDKNRRKTRPVQVGSLVIGSDAPIRLQTMWSDPLEKQDLPDVIRRMNILKEYGCDLIRFTVASEHDIPLIGELSREQVMPIAADIHYHYRYALGAIEAGAAKVRINPGTIGAIWKTREIIRSASNAGCAIRLGLNGGSLPKQYRSLSQSEAMINTAEEYINIFEQEGFKNLVVSLKSSDTASTIEVNREFSSRFDYPLHIGVTEAGPLIPSVVKSTYAMTKLLEEGIGDTMRISISDSMEKEIITAREILKLLGLSPGGITLISCPKCGRASFDTHKFMQRFEHQIHRMNSSLTIACMGCTVNGLEEARHADLGITGAGEKVFIFRHGKIIREVDPSGAGEAFFEELKKYE